MKIKEMVECMNKDCRTIIVAEHVDGLNCLRCGGMTRPRAFVRTEKQDGHCKAKELTIQVNADTTGALEGIKEVTEAANECAVALEKLEKAMAKFRLNKEPIKFDLPKTVWGTAIQQTADAIKLSTSQLTLKD